MCIRDRELHNFDPINTAKGVYFDMEFAKGFSAGFSAVQGGDTTALNLISESQYSPQVEFGFHFQQRIFVYNDISLSAGLQDIVFQNNQDDEQVLSLNTDFFGYSKGGHSYSYGLEWTHNKINSEAYAFDLELDFERITGFSNRRPIPSRYPGSGSSAYSFAVYLNWIYELNEMTSLNAGLRFTSSS